MALPIKTNLTNKIWSNCKYTIKVNIEFEDGTIRKLNNSQILSMYMEKDYDNDHLPIIMLDLVLSNKDRDNIDEKTLFHIHMEQYYLENNKDTSEQKMRKVFLDEKFSRVNFGTNINANEKIDQQIRDSYNMTDDQLLPTDYSKQNTYVLIKKSDFNSIKKMVNEVITDATQQDIVAWLLTRAKIGKKVLMSPFTNQRKVKELILQPRTVLEQLIFLEDEFGWYTEGGYIFLDYDIMYIIRKNGKPTAWLNNKPKNICFYISDSDTADSGATGVILDNDTMYVNINSQGFLLSDSSLVEDQVSGSNMILINTTSGSSTVIKTDTKKFDLEGTYTTKMHHGHNPYTTSQFKRIREENKHIWKFVGMDLDISELTPEKQYSFITNMTKYADRLKGYYRISSMSVNFIKRGEHFNNEVNLIVKKASI